MNAGQVCIKCEIEFQYIPFLCDLCGGSMCLNCTSDDGTAFCDNCKDIQVVSIELAKPQPKCTYCNKNALFIEECMPVKQRKKEKKSTCINIIEVCKDHVVKCVECDCILCKYCAVYKRCKNHLEYCQLGCHYVEPAQIAKCAKCDKLQCNLCLVNGNPYSCNVWLTRNLMLCGTHIGKCTCDAILYDAPVFVCSYPYCKQVACQSGWFSLINKTVYACHKHQSECLICYKTYPTVYKRSIKFRGDNPWECCFNCYRMFRDGVVGVLFAHRWDPLMAQIPKDVLALIFRQHLQNVKKISHL